MDTTLWHGYGLIPADVEWGALNVPFHVVGTAPCKSNIKHRDLKSGVWLSGILLQCSPAGAPPAAPHSRPLLQENSNSPKMVSAPKQLIWSWLLVFFIVWIHWSSVCFLDIWRLKKRSVGKSHHPFLGATEAWNELCFFKWLNSLLRFTQPRLHFPSSRQNNQTCHGPNEGQSITFAFKQHYLGPVVFSVFFYCSWSWNTFQMWFCKGSRKVIAKSRCSGWPAANPRCPGVGVSLPAASLQRGPLWQINPDFCWRNFFISLRGWGLRALASSSTWFFSWPVCWRQEVDRRRAVCALEQDVRQGKWYL